MIRYEPALKREYENTFAGAQLRPERLPELDKVISRIIAEPCWFEYQQVEKATGVPAYVVGIIHSRESSGNFKTHLHNGDPLSGRTRHVPADRPPNGEPPFEWTESAIDALTMPGQGLDKWHDWSIGGICWVLEKYNGFGYRNHGVPSPYLWSYTTAYVRGMYVADGVWDPSAVNKSPGGMAILKRMIDRSLIPAPGATASPQPDAPVDPRPGTLPDAPPAPPDPVVEIISPWDRIKAIQVVLGVKPDADFGNNTLAALNKLLRSVGQAGL